MKMKLSHRFCAVALAFFLPMLTVACSDETKATPTKEEVKLEPGSFDVDHPEIFKLVKVGTEQLPNVLTANGSVNPDVNRTIHVTSQGSGRVIELNVKLGDSVKKGQLLLSLYSSDLSGAFSDYQKAVADEQLAKRAVDRAQMLYSRGAIAQKDLEQAQDAEDKALVDVHNAEQHVRILGGVPSHPSSTIELRAPVTGTIVEQNVSGFEGIKSLDNSPNLFTIADLSQVWVLCDVYENDLGSIKLGDSAEVRLNAYPDEQFHGAIADISRILDPNLRSAKVRIVLSNPDGSLRPGMYATATFRSKKLQPRLVIPGTAVMRLQDKDWVFRKQSQNRFQQLEVHVIGTAENGMQKLQDGVVSAGDEVAADALAFSTEVSEKKE
jgi:cobalt-zinc-cadmium efflux system membrane fusion protein